MRIDADPMDALYHSPNELNGQHEPTEPENSEVPESQLTVTAQSMLKDFPELRPPLIDGVLRLTETANMIDAAKGGKTHTAIDLCLSICTGRAWLGRFPILSPGPVLYIDAELHQNTMARRIASICAARGIFVDEIAGKLDVLSLRGRLRDIFGLQGWLASTIKTGRYKAIFFDALYRLVPPGIDENSNSDMTRVFNAVDQIAETTGAAVIIIHHASKGIQAGKSVVDVGSGASAMARATDTHWIFRQHDEDGCKVMETAARSWPPLPPTVLRWDYPVWKIDEALDPANLRVEGRRKRKDDGPESTPEPQIKWTAAMFVETFVRVDPKTEAMLVSAAMEGEMSERQAVSASPRLCRPR